PAPPRDRPRAGHRPEAAAARRAGRRHEPERDGRPDGADPQDPRPRRHRAPHRAPHEPRDAHLRPRRGARLRGEDRRGDAGRGEPRPAGDRGVPGQGGGDVTPSPPAAATPLLAVENLEAGYGPINVLHRLSLTVNRGESVTI